MFEAVTPRTIWNRIASELGTDFLTNEGSFVYDVLAPAVYEIYRVYLSMNALEPMFYIDETSGPYIDKLAGIFGMTRKAGTRAVCGITLTGDDGAAVPAGAVFLTADGLAFTLDAPVALTGGTGTGTLTAAETGNRYNIGAGELVRTQHSYYGLTAFVNGAAGGGTDEETDAALVSRFYAALRKPATSGNGYHYQQWATEVSGVGAARVIALWDGPGTVKVIMTGPDMLPVDGVVLAAAAAHIGEQRPIGASVTCQPADAVEISVSAAVSVAEGTTLQAVAAEYAAAVSEYIISLTAEKFPAVLTADETSAPLTVGYHKLAALLIDCDGVLDFSGFRVNGGTANVTMGVTEIPVPGEVALT